MGSRRLGFALIAIGLLGFLTLPVLGPVAAPRWGGFGWMGSMHRSMHGYAAGSGVAPGPVSGAPEVTVTARDYSFEPNEIDLRQGETANLTLVNEGDQPHDITIPSLGFSLPAAPGSSATASVTVDRAGSFEFFCSVPGHREAGMSGLVRVG